jgi:hypothetical protein
MLRQLAEELELFCEATPPSQNREVIAKRPTNTASRASAEIFTATDVWLNVNLGLKDLRDLINRREITISAKDKKRKADQVNVYRVTLSYKGRGVSDV